MKSQNYTYLLIFAIFISVFIGNCRPQDQPDYIEVESGQMVLMGTFGHLKVRCCDEETGRAAIQRGLEALAVVDQCFNVYREDSQLSQINRLGDVQWVPVSQETWDILSKAKDYWQLSGGAFDITVGPLSRLWKQAGKNDKLPSEEEIQAAMSLVGSDKLLLTPSGKSPAVHLAKAGMEINANALAEGWAVQRTMQAMKGPGIYGGLVDIGGEVACFSNGEHGGSWRIGIQDPFAVSPNSTTLLSGQVLDLKNGGVSTSGNYRHYATIAGQHYSHIIDPRSGRPADKLPSVTIVAPHTVEADALATCVSVLGAADGLKLIESITDAECLLIEGDAEKPILHYSSGWQSRP